MKIGLALGSGGAKGYAAVGILKGFLEEGINVDLISGTSIGAFIGAVYSEGNINKLLDDTNRLDFKKIPWLLTPTLSAKGLFSGKNIEKYLFNFVSTKSIEDLPIPLYIHATDIKSSKVVVFSRGDLMMAVRSSISIPGLFTPVHYDNKILVDGAFIDPVPVRTLRENGADIVIGIDLLTSASTQEFGGTNKYFINKIFNENMFDIIQRSSVITQSELIRLRFEKYPPDIVIRPNVSGINTLDFHKRDKGIQIGYEEFKKVLPELKKLLNN